MGFRPGLVASPINGVVTALLGLKGPYGDDRLSLLTLNNGQWDVLATIPGPEHQWSPPTAPRCSLTWRVNIKTVDSSLLRIRTGYGPN